MSTEQPNSLPDLPWRSDGFSMFVTHTDQKSSVVLAQVVDKVSFGDGLRMATPFIVVVEVDFVVGNVRHCVSHGHL
jgi:hypothetical protein